MNIRVPSKRFERGIFVAVALAIVLMGTSARAERDPVLDAPTKEPSTSGALAERAGSKRDLRSKTVLLVRTPGDDAVMNLVRAELRAYGWRIIEVALQNGSATPEPLAALAVEQAASAAMRVEPRIGEIEIFVERSWGNVDEVLRGESGQLDPRVLAWRTTEALRAHGLDRGPDAIEGPSTAAELQASDPQRLTPDPPLAKSKASSTPPTGPRSERATVQKEPIAATSGLWVQVAPAVMASPGGMGLGIAGWVGVRLDSSSWWSVSAKALLPVSSHWVLAPEGSARIATSMVGATVEAAWLRRSFGTAAMGVGLAALVTTTQGQESRPGFRTATDRVTTMAPECYSRLALVLGPNWRAFGLLLGGLSLPEIRVVFGDEQVSSWGKPYALVALGLEMGSGW